MSPAHCRPAAADWHPNRLHRTGAPHCALGPVRGGRDRRVSGTRERSGPQRAERGGERGEHGSDGTLCSTAEHVRDGSQPAVPVCLVGLSVATFLADASHPGRERPRY